MNYFIIAGEASGDLHGANLVREIIRIDPQAHFQGFGGDKMKQAGMDLIVHYKTIAYMGFREVFLNIFTILRALKLCKSSILSSQPDTLILIDYPGFNLKIAKFAKQNNIKVIYYISPQLWAWKENRIKIIRENVDKMICILPFEQDFYKKWNYQVDYAGHPLVHEINNFKPDPDFLTNNNLGDKPIIAVLPGSRKQEINKILPVLLTIRDNFPDYDFVIAGSSDFSMDFYNHYMIEGNVKIIFNNTYNILSHAVAGLITSGTASLETALFEVPLIVCYKTTFITYYISKKLIRCNYISLVNLVSDKPVVKELIQYNLTPENLTSELNKIINDKEYHLKMISDLKEIKHILGEENASENAAHIIYNYLSDR